MKVLTSLVLGLFTLIQCHADARAIAQPGQTLAQQVKPAAATQDFPIKDPDLTTFAEAVKAAGIYDLFVGTGPFTAFGPSNAAFEKIGKEKLKELMDPVNKDKLTTILLYHIVPGKYLAKTIKSETVRTINGKDLTLVNDNGNVTVNGAKIVKADLVGPNGVIQVIDTVLFP